MSDRAYKPRSEAFIAPPNSLFSPIARSSDPEMIRVTAAIAVGIALEIRELAAKKEER